VSIMTSNMLEAMVGTSGAVVLCGSGVSAVHPSSVPTWSALNSAALDSLRRLALEKVVSAPSNRKAILSIHASDVPMVTFSQVLSDAFAGRKWLDILTVLDGEVTNPVHRALASLIRGRRCPAIITTNFDTLIERACRESGFEIPVVLPHVGSAHGIFNADLSQPALYKIHGTVSSPETMVDLLYDKAKGLNPSTCSMIASVCRDRHLVVMGFSGADFAINPDYLGLLSNAALPARVTWIVLPASGPHEGAQAFLDALSAQGVPVAVEQHELLDLVGAASAEPVSKRDAERRVGAHVGDWIDAQLIFPPIAALILARLLRLRGQGDSAAAVRAEIRDVLPRLISGAPDLIHAAGAWAFLGQEEATWELLGDERDEHTGKRALADMALAEVALDRVGQISSERNINFSPGAIEEQQLLRAAIKQNTAVACLSLRKTEAATRLLAEAEEVLQGVQGRQAFSRLGRIHFLRAMLDFRRYRVHQAMIAFELSISYAHSGGDVELEVSSCFMLAMCLRASGDWELADSLDKRATGLGVVNTAAEWRTSAEDAARQGSSLLALGMFKDLGSGLSPDPPWDELPAARAAGDRDRVVDALVANVERDVKAHRGARLGQTLLSLALATGDTSPTSRFGATIRALCSDDLSRVPAEIRFLLKVTELGISVVGGDATIPRALIDELRLLAQPFGYKVGIFIPGEFQLGVCMLARAAAQTGFEAFQRGEYEDAERLYGFGHRGLWMVYEHEDAARAELYRFDALSALGRHAEAAECLNGIRDFASRCLPIPYLSRQLEFLAWRAKRGDPANWPTEARTLADLATSIAQRSRPHFNSAMLIAAIHIIHLQQVDLAKGLICQVNASALSDDEAELRAQAMLLIEEGSAGAQSLLLGSQDGLPHDAIPLS
jgi:hypothetical protein